MEIEELILWAPCCFCGYNGPDYFSAGSHKKYCYWYHIGGERERIQYFKKAIKEGRIRIMEPYLDVEEYYK